ncbi:MAG: PQQ-binding-like beta-propeller repeat protein [Theionarchaea archaeon]|nr:PQQ-binding-like beta-propeller repeat protein [Theionarchaea archaeon]
MKKRKYSIVLAVICLPLAGAACLYTSEWADYLGNPQRTGYSGDNGPEMPETLWEVNIPGDFDTSPFIAGDKVLLLWKDDMYHLVKTKVFLLDLCTGDIEKELNSDLIFKAFFMDDHILGVSIETIHEIDRISGEITFLSFMPKKSFVMTSLYPLILEDRIVIPTTPVVCLSSSDFHTLWTLGDTSDSDLEPVCLAGDESLIIFVARKNGIAQLVAVDPSNGIIKWRIDPLRGARWLAMGKDAIYCGGRNLWAFDRDGKQLWVFFPHEGIVSNIVVGKDALYIVDEANTLCKVDFSGSLVWKTEWEVSPWFYETHLLGTGDILYCIGNYGDAVSVDRSQVTAHSMEDGSRLWDVEFGPSQYVKGSPALAGGVLVIGTTNGTVIALASDPELYVRQGDALLSKNLREKAIDSYKKAAEFYEKKGNMNRSQEIQMQIELIENLQTTTPKTPETPPPDSYQPSPLSTSPPETPPVSSLLLPESSSHLISVLAIVVLIGIFISYVFFKKRKSRKTDIRK